MDRDLELLVGKIITKIEVEENGESITFYMEDGEFKFNAIGDCCSSSWIESVEGQEDIIGHRVLEIVEHTIQAYDYEKDGAINKTPHYDHLQVYTYDIVTSNGICTIDFRNDSNGYYGGWLELEVKK